MKLHFFLAYVCLQNCHPRLFPSPWNLSAQKASSPPPTGESRRGSPFGRENPAPPSVRPSKKSSSWTVSLCHRTEACAPSDLDREAHRHALLPLFLLGQHSGPPPAGASKHQSSPPLQSSVAGGYPQRWDEKKNSWDSRFDFFFLETLEKIIVWGLWDLSKVASEFSADIETYFFRHCFRRCLSRSESPKYKKCALDIQNFTIFFCGEVETRRKKCVKRSGLLSF